MQAADRSPPRQPTLVVCLTGFGPAEWAALRPLLEAAGHVLTESLTRSTQVLVAKSNASEKVQHARRHNIAIVTERWLSGLPAIGIGPCASEVVLRWDELTRLRCGVGAHPLLLGAKVCTTSLGEADRGRIKGLCADFGSVFVEDLRRDCAFLVVPDAWAEGLERHRSGRGPLPDDIRRNAKHTFAVARGIRFETVACFAALAQCQPLEPAPRLADGTPVTSPSKPPITRSLLPGSPAASAPSAAPAVPPPHLISAATRRPEARIFIAHAKQRPDAAPPAPAAAAYLAEQQALVAEATAHCQLLGYTRLPIFQRGLVTHIVVLDARAAVVDCDGVFDDPHSRPTAGTAPAASAERQPPTARHGGGVAVLKGPPLTAVTIDWLRACAANKDPSVLPTARPSYLFHREVISFAGPGIDRAAREHFRGVACSLGAVVLEDLVVGSLSARAPETTRLLVAAPDAASGDHTNSAKVRTIYARHECGKSLQCRVVSTAWLEASVARGAFLPDTAPFEVQSDASRSPARVSAPLESPHRPPTALHAPVVNSKTPPRDGSASGPKQMPASGSPSLGRRLAEKRPRSSEREDDHQGASLSPSGLLRAGSSALNTSGIDEAIDDVIKALDAVPSSRVQSPVMAAPRPAEVGAEAAGAAFGLSVQSAFAAFLPAPPPLRAPGASAEARRRRALPEDTQAIGYHGCDDDSATGETTPQKAASQHVKSAAAAGGGSKAVVLTAAPPQAAPQGPAAKPQRTMLGGLASSSKTTATTLETLDVDADLDVYQGGVPAPAIPEGITAAPPAVSLAAPPAPAAPAVPPTSHRYRVFVAKAVRDRLLATMDVRVLIACCGGRVVDTLEGATHYIGMKPTKTETFLSCLAAGQWLLCPQFLEEASRALVAATGLQRHLVADYQQFVADGGITGRSTAHLSAAQPLSAGTALSSIGEERGVPLWRAVAPPQGTAYFPAEEPFEWSAIGNHSNGGGGAGASAPVAALTSTAALASASTIQRLCGPSRRPYAAWRAVLVCTDAARARSFSRVLLNGGCPHVAVLLLEDLKALRQLVAQRAAVMGIRGSPEEALAWARERFVPPLVAGRQWPAVDLGPLLPTDNGERHAEAQGILRRLADERFLPPPRQVTHCLCDDGILEASGTDPALSRAVLGSLLTAGSPPRLPAMAVVPIAPASRGPPLAAPIEGGGVIVRMEYLVYALCVSEWSPLGPPPGPYVV